MQEVWGLRGTKAFSSSGHERDTDTERTGGWDLLKGVWIAQPKCAAPGEGVMT